MLVKRVELAQGRNVEDSAVKQLDFSLKRTAGGNQFTQSVGDRRVLDFNGIKLLTDGLQSSGYQINETVLSHNWVVIEFNC